MEDLDNIINELKNDKNAIKEYLECFYDIDKVKDTFEASEELKKIGDCLNDEE